MDKQGQLVASLRSVVLDLPPSCVEFCPALPDYFVVGTYNLQREGTTSQGEGEESEGSVVRQPQSRNGSLLLYHLDVHELRQVQTLEQPSAILDLHFCPHIDQSDVFAVVSSTGTVAFYKLSVAEGSGPCFLELGTHRPLGGDETTLILSCCWHPTRPDLLAITTSTYEVHVLQVDKSWHLSRTNDSPILTHSLEAWTVALSLDVPTPVDSEGSNGERFTVYSGGDDSKLFRIDCSYYPETEQGEEIVEALSSVSNIRGHEAGVTAILPLNVHTTDGASVLLSGSYDDHLRAFAVYAHGQKPRLLAEENLGGGVWRLKLIDFVSHESGHWSARVLASCMHAGCRVLELSGGIDGDCSITRSVRFEEHKSMNYGSDFQPEPGNHGRPLRFVSTSFYDKLLCLWEQPS